MSIKPVPPSPPSVPTSETTNAASTQKQSLPSIPGINPKVLGEALKRYNELREKLKGPFLKGAAGLFTDKIVFPPELLDPNNPANDPKFLHLLFATFGMKELEKYFATPEQEEEMKKLEEEAEEGSEESEEDQK